MKIGFTGTRDGMTRYQKVTVAVVLQALKPTELHHGDCIGADAEAHDLAAALSARIIIHPPEVSRHRAHCQVSHGELRGQKDYLSRNRDIVDETEVLIATPKESSEQPKGGTWYTVRYARMKKRPINIVWPDGKLTVEPGERA